MQKYSDFFKTLHDETGPTGYLGQGTHYSVLRAVVFHDPLGKILPEGQFADFAVIWDGDHDIRVMEPIEEIYRRGLLPSFTTFGEHKGFFTAILSNKITEALEATPRDSVFSESIDELGLSVNSSLCLKNDGIVCIGDLVQKTEAELLRTPNFGPKRLFEIKEVLVDVGLRLGMEIPGSPREKDVRLASWDKEINAICQSLNDPWGSAVVGLETGSNPIIRDKEEKVRLYLKNLEMLWQLGIVERQKPASLVSEVTLPSESVEPVKKFGFRPTHVTGSALT